MSCHYSAVGEMPVRGCTLGSVIRGGCFTNIWWPKSAKSKLKKERYPSKAIAN